MRTLIAIAGIILFGSALPHLHLANTAAAQTIQSIKHSDAADTVVLFIHGLDGHPKCTFAIPKIKGSFKTNECEKKIKETWFSLLSPTLAGQPYFHDRKLGDLDIATLDYRDAFGSSSTIEGIGSQVRLLASFRQLFVDYNHIVIVAHSMGGLVVKAALSQMQADNTERNHLNRVLGVVMLGVPANGAPLADLTSGTAWGKVAAWLFGVSYQNIDDLKTAAAGNNAIVDQQARWIYLRTQRADAGYPLRVACGFETKSEGFNITIVSRLYANDQCDAQVGINRSHTELTNLTNGADDLAQGLLAREVLAAGFDHLQSAGPIEWGGRGLPLGMLVARLEDFGPQLDRTGFGLYPESVVFEPGQEIRVKGLYLQRDRTYHAGNHGDLFRQIALDHSCLHATFSGRAGRVITLGLTGSAEACPAQANGWACRPRDCPS